MPLHPPDPVDSRVLHDLANSLIRTLGESSSSVIVHLAITPDGHKVGFLPLEGRSPTDLLLGSVAAEHWGALGVAARGSTRKLDHHGSVGRRFARAGVVVLVDRGGHVVSRVQTGGGRVLTAPPASGATLDCLQRALGLPTAAPEDPPGLAFAQVWLDNVAATGQGPASLTWSEVTELHPARQLLATDDPNDATDLVTAARALDRVCDWEHLRWLAVEGRWPACVLDGADAAWFDAGGFARWVLGSRPGLPTLLDGVCAATGENTARQCAHALEELGLLRRGAWRPPRRRGDRQSGGSRTR